MCDWWENNCSSPHQDEQRSLCPLKTWGANRTTLTTDLQLMMLPLECPAMSEVVLRMPRAGGTTPSSAWVRGTELARVETRRRSGWSSLRLRRNWLRLGSLKLRPLSRLIRLWETTSSKRSRCFLGMKILANIVGSDTASDWQEKKKTQLSNSPDQPLSSHWTSHILKKDERSLSASILYPDLSIQLASEAVHIRPLEKRRILGLITYRCYCRIHLIGSKIVQSISSPGRAEAVRRGRSDDRFLRARVCEGKSEISDEFCLCAPVPLAAASVSVQHQLAANSANRRRLESRAPSGRNYSSPPASVVSPSHNQLPCPFSS